MSSNDETVRSQQWTMSSGSKSIAGDLTMPQNAALGVMMFGQAFASWVLSGA